MIRKILDKKERKMGEKFKFRLGKLILTNCGTILVTATVIQVGSKH